MKGIKRNILLSALSILGLWACSKIGNPVVHEGGADGNASVVFTIAGDVTATKANDDVTIYTGSKFSSLRVWLVDNTGKVIKFWSADYASGAEKTQETVVLNEVARATYSLYVLANSSALDSFTLGTTVTAAGFKDKTLAQYDYSTSAMPLSYAGSLNVLPGVNTVGVKMLRTSGRYSLNYFNHSLTNNIIISSASLSSFKPSSTYFFNHNYQVPAGVTYSAMNSIPSTLVAPNTNSVVLDQFLFEGAAPSYTLSLAGGVFPTAVTSSSGTMTLGTQGATRNLNDLFLISNGGWYLGIVSGALTAVSATPAILMARADFANFLWTFTTETGGGTILNNGTSQYLVPKANGISISTTYPTALFTNIYQVNSSLAFTYVSGSTYYQLDNYRNGQVNMYQNSSPNLNEQWRTTSYSLYVDGVKANKTFVKRIAINYIDRYGAASPITAMKRNEHVKTIVNLYYNADTGSFFYEVDAWRPVSGDITFD